MKRSIARVIEYAIVSLPHANSVTLVNFRVSAWRALDRRIIQFTKADFFSIFFFRFHHHLCLFSMLHSSFHAFHIEFLARFDRRFFSMYEFSFDGKLVLS